MAFADHFTRRSWSAPLADPANAPTLSQVDSAQIDLCRVICIFFMMTVHVFPYAAEGTAFETGILSPLYTFSVDWMGRASVAALSLFGGYILWIGARDKPILKLARSKFMSVFLPMVFWNLALIAGVFAVAFLGAVDGRQEFYEFFATHGSEASSFRAWLTMLFAIEGKPANVPVSFLRDLFVSMLLIRLAVPVIRRYGAIMIAVVFLLGAMEATAPVLLRPNILLFALSGAYLASLNVKMSTLRSPALAILTGLLFLVAYAIALALPEEIAGLTNTLPNLLKRFALISFLLLATGAVVQRYDLPGLVKLRPILFLAFLSHAVVLIALKRAFLKLDGDMTGASYVVLFFVTPFLIIALAYVATPLIDRLPRPAQLMFRGSAVKP